MKAANPAPAPVPVTVPVMDAMPRPLRKVQTNTHIPPIGIPTPLREEPTINRVIPTLPREVLRPPIFPTPNQEQHTIPQSPTSPTGVSWFVSKPLGRFETEKILELNEEFGNMLVRKRVNAEDEWSHAVSIKPPMDSFSKEKFIHFKVRIEGTPSGDRYFINLCGKRHSEITSWEGVVAYFHSESVGKYIPLKKLLHLPQHNYEDAITRRGGYKRTYSESTPQQYATRPPVLTRGTTQLVLPNYENSLPNYENMG
uniref:SH2 domain-containing protein n=1 Tax=Ciona savignyi TaxID=51511 RepID=H2Z2D7_CIOSA